MKKRDTQDSDTCETMPSIIKQCEGSLQKRKQNIRPKKLKKWLKPSQFDKKLILIQETQQASAE